MTAVAALIDKGVIHMGADSAGVGGLHLVVRKDEKVFVNGPFIMSCTSSFRMIQLLRYSFKPPKRPKCITDAEFMSTVFVDAIRGCFKTGGFARSESGQEAGGTFIVGYKGKLYSIDSDFQVGIPADSFCAAGCGVDLCLGSLYSTKGQPPKERLITALKAAERFSAGVRGPFILKSLGR